MVRPLSQMRKEEDLLVIEQHFSHRGALPERKPKCRQCIPKFRPWHSLVYNGTWLCLSLTGAELFAFP